MKKVENTKRNIDLAKTFLPSVTFYRVSSTKWRNQWKWKETNQQRAERRQWHWYHWERLINHLKQWGTDRARFSSGVVKERTGVKVNTNLLITFFSFSRSGSPSSSPSLSLSRSLSCSVFHESFLDLILSWLYLHFHQLQFMIFIYWLFDLFNVVVLSTWSESSLSLFSEFWTMSLSFCLIKSSTRDLRAPLVSLVSFGFNCWRLVNRKCGKPFRAQTNNC